MPTESKISTAERKRWLEQWETGDPIHKIAAAAKRNPRTVRDHIDRARLEQDFEVARRDQLREALQSHQKDMLGLLEHLRRGLHVPDLSSQDFLGPDFGMEDVWGADYMARNYKTARDRTPQATIATGDEFSGALAFVIDRDMTGPREVIIGAETTLLWTALRQHVGKDQLFRFISSWKASLLKECQGRAELNRAIRAKCERLAGGIPVSLENSPGVPTLMPRLVSWLRARLTGQALGDYVPSLDQEISESSAGTLQFHGQELTRNLESTDRALDLIEKTCATFARSHIVKAAADSYRDLEAKTSRLHASLDEFLLIHHILGRCSLCRKLGGA